MATDKNKSSGKGKKGGVNPSSDPTDTARFEKQIVEESNRREAPTYIKGKAMSSNREARSYFDNWLFYRDRDAEEEPIIISGNDAQIALQASLLKAIDQLLDLRGEGNFNFEQWAEDFCNGFNRFTTGASDLLKKQWQKEVWPGVTKENRPKIVEIKPDGRKQAPADYHVVQFFPNRRTLDEYKIFSGSYSIIATQIENWWNQKAAIGESDEAITEGIDTRSGKPLVELWFKETEPQKRPKKYRIWYRLHSFTDNPFSSRQKMTETDIKKIASSIKQVFFPNPTNRFSYRKGKSQFTYVDMEQGIINKAFVRDQSDAIALMTALLKVQGLKIDLTKLKIVETADANKAYPETPPTVTVLGKSIKAPQRRPKTTVSFYEAKLKLAYWPKPITLVARDGSLFEKLIGTQTGMN